MTPTNDPYASLEWQLRHHAVLDEVCELPPLSIFDEGVIGFLDQVSQRVLASPLARQYPDLASFAFICRRRNLQRLKSQYESRGQRAFGRGVTLHFTPSNVPLNYAYSLYAGLLAGNVCLIRMSSRIFEQATALNAILDAVLEEGAFEAVRRRIGIFRYEKDDALTECLSSRCDVRVIWGSDETIATIRRAPLPARAYDVTFADRFSIAVIDAAGYLARDDAAAAARDFFNDTLFFDQNACTSPRLVYWIGEEGDIVRAQDRFWAAFETICDQRGYANTGNLAVEKLLRQCMCAVELEGESVTDPGALVQRVSLREIPENLERFTAPGGFFMEVRAPDVTGLGAVRTRKLQTITHLGCDGEALVASLEGGAMLGLERVVPSGRAAEFSLQWDGYDLIGQMSKCVSVA